MDPHPLTQPVAPAQRRGPAPFILILVGIGAIGVLVWPVFPGLTLAAVLATLVMPLHRRLLVRLPRRGPAAAVSVLLTGVVVLLPLAGVVALVGTEAVSGIQWLSERQASMAQTPDVLRGTIARTAGRFGVDPNAVIGVIEAQVSRVGEVVAARTLGFLSGIPGVLLQLGVALFSLFYFLRDGEDLIAAVRRLAPLDPTRTDELLTRARDITYATVVGNVLVAIAQGTLGGIAFHVVGIAGATLWGAIMAVFSMIPMVGAGIVWVPVSIYLAVTGRVVEGLGLAAFSALVIGTVDNFIRAIFVGGRAQVHSLVVFLSVLGGVLVFGAAGIVVGPVVFVLALIAIEAGRLAMDGGQDVGASIPTETES